MKNILLGLLAFIFSTSAYSQITLDATYTNTSADMCIDKFHVSGYKYIKKDIPNLKLYVFNINHTLFKTINIPAQADPIIRLDYLSENLFDMDNLMEYALVTYNSGLGLYKFRIYKETGSIILARDTAGFGSSGGNTSNIFSNQEPIFYDGLNTKLRLTVYGSFGPAGKDEIYTLPGSIPCSACTSGTVSGFSTIEGETIEEVSIFPNPVTNQLKLKYKLPSGSHLAEMKIYDTQGKLVDEFKITDHYDFIYLPTNYNNGLYLYSLIVDGKIVKTEKIVLNK